MAAKIMSYLLKIFKSIWTNSTSDMDLFMAQDQTTKWFKKDYLDAIQNNSLTYNGNKDAIREYILRDAAKALLWKNIKIRN